MYPSGHDDRPLCRGGCRTLIFTGPVRPGSHHPGVSCTAPAGSRCKQDDRHRGSRVDLSCEAGAVVGGAIGGICQRMLMGAAKRMASGVDPGCDREPCPTAAGRGDDVVSVVRDVGAHSSADCSW
jgi:hypothetical protein